MSHNSDLFPTLITDDALFNDILSFPSHLSGDQTTARQLEDSPFEDLHYADRMSEDTISKRLV